MLYYHLYVHEYKLWNGSYNKKSNFLALQTRIGRLLLAVLPSVLWSNKNTFFSSPLILQY
jgi:hypothetical protein